MTRITDERLLPCPFCGGTDTRILERGRIWHGMAYTYSAPTSFVVLHHCEPVSGQPSRGIERIGRDLESAIAAWNRRAPSGGEPERPDVAASLSELLDDWESRLPGCVGAVIRSAIEDLASPFGGKRP